MYKHSSVSSLKKTWLSQGVWSYDGAGIAWVFLQSLLFITAHLIGKKNFEMKALMGELMTPLSSRRSAYLIDGHSSIYILLG